MKQLFFLTFFCALIFGANAQSWNLTGNAATTSTHFIGTTDQQPLIFKTHNLERMRLAKCDTRLGIGVQDPYATLHVHYAPYLLEECSEVHPLGNQVLGNQILQITDKTTGSGRNNGFGIYLNRYKEVTLKQKEEANLYLEGPNGGLTIAPNGNIGMGTDLPTQKLHVVDGNILISKSSTKAPQSPNGSILFGADITNVNPEGKWGIEYLNGEDNAYGLNFWRPWIPGGGANYVLFLGNDNNVGIGMKNPKAKLDVKGTIRAEEVKVCLNQGCDFVFEEDYELMGLDELEKFININKHLPEVAPAAAMEAEGINLSEMTAKLLQKIEELTLYIIQIEKRLSEVENKKGGE